MTNQVLNARSANGKNLPSLGAFKSVRHILVGAGPELANLKVMFKRNGCTDIISLTPEGLVDADVFSIDRLNISYIFADGVDDEIVSAVLQRIRNDARENTGLQPVMVLTSTMTESRAVGFLNMGVDHSIVSPLSEAVIASKIGLSVDKPFRFFRTQTYFGPDRRRATGEENNHHLRGTGIHEWQEISVARSVSRGSYVKSVENKSTALECQAA